MSRVAIHMQLSNLGRAGQLRRIFNVHLCRIESNTPLAYDSPIGLPVTHES